MKSRYKRYAEGINRLQAGEKTKQRKKSTPGSILQKLKELKNQEFSMTVPIGAADGK
jgi:hypothetical protein